MTNNSMYQNERRRRTRRRASAEPLWKVVLGWCLPARFDGRDPGFQRGGGATWEAGKSEKRKKKGAWLTRKFGERFGRRRSSGGEYDCDDDDAEGVPLLERSVRRRARRQRKSMPYILILSIDEWNRTIGKHNEYLDKSLSLDEHEKSSVVETSPSSVCANKNKHSPPALRQSIKKPLVKRRVAAASVSRAGAMEASASTPQENRHLRVANLLDLDDSDINGEL